MSTEKQLKFAQPRGSQNFYNNFIDINAELFNACVNKFKKKEYFFGYIFLFSYTPLRRRLLSYQSFPCSY